MRQTIKLSKMGRYWFALIDGEWLETAFMTTMNVETVAHKLAVLNPGYNVEAWAQ